MVGLCSSPGFVIEEQLRVSVQQEPARLQTRRRSYQSLTQFAILGRDSSMVSKEDHDFFVIGDHGESEDSVGTSLSAVHK